MNLAIDIGNTFVKTGVFDGDKLVATAVYKRFSIKVIESLAYNHSIRNVILSTVRRPNKKMESYIEKNFLFIKLTERTSLPIKNLYQTPETLGKDRLAAVVGAKRLFLSDNCLVVDAGTCITFDIINKAGEYLGGNISPGINMRLKAMHTYTANLPVVKRENHDLFYGVNTETALLNGGQLGAILETKAFIGLCEEHFGEIKVIFTGGDAKYLADKLKTRIFVRQNLVLEGLNKILNYNVEKK